MSSRDTDGNMNGQKKNVKLMRLPEKKEQPFLSLNKWIGCYECRCRGANDEKWTYRNWVAWVVQFKGYVARTRTGAVLL